MMIRSTSLAVVLAAAAGAQNPEPIAPVTAPIRTSRAIDLVICLDVSGSMSGLIHAARQNLWAIVNEMATLRPQPELRVALLTYGCPAYGEESGFVRIETPLTGDLDLVSQKLFELGTNGGDEYVARVVKRSLDALDWSADPQALKMIFVAGNEAATQDPEFDALQLAGQAIGKGVLVNTIYCGPQQKPEADGWRQVARRADGSFSAIEQDEQLVIATPFDKRLQELSTQWNATYVYYGRQRAAWSSNQVAQDLNAAKLNSAAAAQRCQTKGSSLYFNPQHDLVDACRQKDFELAAVKKEDLPEALRKLTVAELRAHVDKMGEKRKVLQKQIAAIGKQRDAFVAAERKRRRATGEKLFEEAMLEAVRAQAESRGFARKVSSPDPEAAEGRRRF
ncbi:MAG TPA: VWA domain-containing protein [bacterium]|nr:VWA domain-containing protein [bacterium]